jgi:hypothetical protein
MAMLAISENLGPGRRKPVVAQRQWTSTVQVHMGKSLIRHAQFYPDLLTMALEAVQNSIDNGAMRIKVEVDLQNRIVVFSDDGEGASRDKFETALRSIGDSIKPKDKLGRFGFGLISPLGKCQSFTFTACEQGNEEAGFIRWKFVTSEIEEMREVNGIPAELVSEFVYDPENKLPNTSPKLKRATRVWWRAQLRIKNLVSDRTITRFDPFEFQQNVLAKYRRPMLRKGIRVGVKFTNEDGNTHNEVNIAASEYDGRHLEIIEMPSDHAGKIKFDLYLARNTGGGPNGKIHFSELDDEHGLTAEQFVRCAEDAGFLDKPVADALTSGVFEGEIMAEKIKLHPDRKRFERDDALLDLCINIEEWFKNHGRQYIEAQGDEDKRIRYQKAGLVAMKSLEELLAGGEYEEILGRFKWGTIGRGHTPPNTPIIETIEENALSTDGGTLGKRKNEEKPSDRDRKEPTEERKAHHPHTVEGPRGKKRVVVKGGSVGIRFKFGELEITSDVFKFDSDTGELIFNTIHPYFNTIHPYWGQCEKSDMFLIRYIETVAQTAISLVSFEKSEFHHTMQKAFMGHLKMQVHSILKTGTLLKHIRDIKKEHREEENRIHRNRRK